MTTVDSMRRTAASIFPRREDHYEENEMRDCRERTKGHPIFLGPHLPPVLLGQIIALPPRPSLLLSVQSQCHPHRPSLEQPPFHECVYGGPLVYFPRVRRWVDVHVQLRTKEPVLCVMMKCIGGLKWWGRRRSIK